MRKLLVAPNYNYFPREHRLLRPERPGTTPRCPTTRTGPLAQRHGEPRRRPAPRVPARAAPPLEGRARLQRGLHLRPLRRHRPDAGGSSLGGSSTTPTTSRWTGGRTPTWSRTASSSTAPGTSRWAGPQARRRHAGLGQRALRRLDGLDDLPGPQRHEPHPVLQRLLLVRPLEYGPVPRRNRGHRLLRSWRPDVVGDPTAAPTRDQCFDQTAYAVPATGQFGNAKKGSLTGAGHLGRELRHLQGHRDEGQVPAAVLGAPRQRLQPPAVLPGLRGPVRRPERLPGDG